MIKHKQHTKYSMNKKLIIFLAVLLPSCAAKLMPPAESDLARVAAKYPGVTLANLQDGKRLYETKCTQCHGAKKPSSQTVEGWQKIVPGMAEEAKKKGKQEITAGDQDLILKYLIAMREK